MSSNPVELLGPGNWLYVAITLLIVGFVAARSRLPALLLAGIVAVVLVTMFNLQSPFQASYLSSFAFTVYISWLIYIAIIRVIFPRHTFTPNSQLLPREDLQLGDIAVESPPDEHRCKYCQGGDPEVQGLYGTKYHRACHIQAGARSLLPRSGEE
jgi:hypothetical protein